MPYFRPHIVAIAVVLAVFSPTWAGPNTDLQNLDRLTKQPALERFDVAGKELPSNLFLVRTRAMLPEEDGVVVHGAHGSVHLVSGDPEKVWNLTRRGCTVLPVEDWEISVPPVARDWSWISTPDPDVAAMVGQVEWTGVLDKIQWLVGFDTRFSFAANQGDVAEAIHDRFADYGLQSTLHSYVINGVTIRNVEATQIGARYPDSYVVICGHFDTVSEQPMTLAPGADDNATGTAAVLTAAEILSQYTFDYSIRYVCFGAEEQGLVGSYFYTAGARQKNLDIIGAINFDMLGYWEPGVGVERDLEIETNHASQWLAQAIVNAADLYTNAQYELHVDDWAWWGDHFRFWLAGYPAVNHEEAWDWYDPDFNPYYHTSQDLPQYLNPEFTVDNVQVAVAALATLANAGTAVQVSLDVIPGSCPNPFNPKSRGLIPATILGSDEFEVTDISIGTLRIEGLAPPVKVRVADVGSTGDGLGYPCGETSPDGFADLLLKFTTQDIAAALGPAGKRDAVRLRLTGRLLDGTAIEGEDVVAIVGNTEAPALAGQSIVVPETFALYQNVPNPFNPTTVIHYDVPRSGGKVTLRIYDVAGRLVQTLVDGVEAPGVKRVTWDGRNSRGSRVATGVYFYRMSAAGFTETRKMVLLQ